MRVAQATITRKADSKKAVSLDNESNMIQVKDTVRAIEGAHAVCRRPFHIEL